MLEEHVHAWGPLDPRRAAHAQPLMDAPIVEVGPNVDMPVRKLVVSVMGPFIRIVDDLSM